MKPIYLDHNATTPLHPGVLESMLPLLREHYGNPSSVHRLGRVARVRLDEAREAVAALIQAHPREIVFTSGGTESDNWALVGGAFAFKNKGRHIITNKIEHAAILNCCKQLESLGFEVEYLDVDSKGFLDPERVRESLRSDTILVSVQHANSEIGTVQDIVSIGEIAKEMGVLMHTDAVQTAGKITVDINRLPVDLLSLSAHKIYGPKGVGALFIRRGSSTLTPLINGGGQEFKRRGGTENVPGIVGFGKAAEIAQANLNDNRMNLASLRDQLWNFIEKEIPDVERFGSPGQVLPNTLGLTFEGIGGGDLLMALDMEGIAVSTGSACSSGTLGPSHVLAALGVPETKIEGSVRISLGRDNTLEEIDRIGQVLKHSVERMRATNVREEFC